MNDVIFLYHGTNRQNHVRRYVVRQVAESVDLASRGPVQPTGPLAWQAVLLGRPRTHRLGWAGTCWSQANCPMTITAEIPTKCCSAIKTSKYLSWVAYRGEVCYLWLPVHDWTAWYALFNNYYYYYSYNHFTALWILSGTSWMSHLLER